MIEAIQDRVAAITGAYPALVAAGRNMADPFVIAAAMISNPVLTVVTEEGPTSGSARRPNIPFICREENIDFCSLIEILRRTGFGTP